MVDQPGAQGVRHVQVSMKTGQEFRNDSSPGRCLNSPPNQNAHSIAGCFASRNHCGQPKRSHRELPAVPPRWRTVRYHLTTRDLIPGCCYENLGELVVYCHQATASTAPGERRRTFFLGATGTEFTPLQEMDTAGDSTVTPGSLNHNELLQKTRETYMCETGIKQETGRWHGL